MSYLLFSKYNRESFELVREIFNDSANSQNLNTFQTKNILEYEGTKKPLDIPDFLPSYAKASSGKSIEILEESMTLV